VSMNPEAFAILFIGALIGGFFSAFVFDLLEWNPKEWWQFLTRYFTKKQRLFRVQKRLERRIENIERLEKDKAMIQRREVRIAELEQQLVDKAFSQPEEFLDSK